MTRADQLRDLARRVEAAQGADRAIDAEVWAHTVKREALARAGDWKVARGWDGTCSGALVVWDQPPPHAAGTGAIWGPAPAYTASLDAAVSLVPAGHSWSVYGGEREEGHATAYCVPNGGRLPWPRWVDDVNAAKPALALTAAAMRALAEEAPHG
jgi:hypothetical protein